MSLDVLKNIHESNQADVDKYLKTFSGVIKKVLEKIKVSAIANLKGISPDDVLAYDLKWAQILKQAGYYKLVDDLIDKQFTNVAQSASKAFKAGGLDSVLTKENIKQLGALKSMDREFFTTLGANAGLEVKKSLYKYVISDTSLETMAQGINQKLVGSNLAKYSETYARTSIKNFQQAVIDTRAAESEDGVWVYVGVSDDVTRDYCNKILNVKHYYNNSQKSKIENDPLRQYNCRHRLYKISKETAKEEGYSKH